MTLRLTSTKERRYYQILLQERQTDGFEYKLVVLLSRLNDVLLDFRYINQVATGPFSLLFMFVY